MTTFLSFDFREEILRAVDDLNFKIATSIQEKSIPIVLEGKDLIASAKTGTGKTASFLLPLLQILSTSDLSQQKGPQVLILVPTRELALQISDEAKKFSKYIPHIKTVCIYGGVPYPIQKRALVKPYNILVATPGRLIDHMEQGYIDLSKLKTLVLDEADRMLDMGFINPIEQIIKSTPQQRQTLLFSATIDNKILPFSKKFQKNPEEIKLDEHKAQVNNIQKLLYYTDNISHKLCLLEHILTNTENMDQAIIFTATQYQANNLSKHLTLKGQLSSPLHGGMNQRQRSKTLERMRKGDINLLVATDVAARGIDITTISHVINFDLPRNPEDFVHRIGRTGRAGAHGTAITFATPDQKKCLTKINSLIDSPMILQTVEGLQPKPAPAFKKPENRNHMHAKKGSGGKKHFFNRKPPRRHHDQKRKGSEK